MFKRNIQEVIGDFVPLIRKFSYKYIYRRVCLNDAGRCLTPQRKLSCFVLNILDHCNLRCKGCDHFAAIAMWANDLTVLNGNVPNRTSVSGLHRLCAGSIIHNDSSGLGIVPAMRTIDEV